MRASSALLAVVFIGCGQPTYTVVVDLRTDYAPGREVVRVETTVLVGGDDARSVSPYGAAPTDDLVMGQRIAEVDDIPAGPVVIDVILRDAAGSVIASRRTRVTVEASTGVLVVITRACAGRSCPGAADPAQATECHGGECVEPTCNPEDPTTCPAALCTSDDECTAPVACASATCTSGLCFAALDDSRCAAGEQCDVAAGCIAVTPVDSGAPPMDGGTDSGATCSPPCNDGVACTIDRCTAGMCTSTPDDAACNDGNTCTLDTCDPASGCEYRNRNLSCSDGIFCNGVDRCFAGVCTPSGVDPCAGYTIPCMEGVGGGCRLTCDPMTGSSECDGSGIAATITSDIAACLAFCATTPGGVTCCQFDQASGLCSAEMGSPAATGDISLAAGACRL